MFRVNIESQGKLAIPLQASTFIVAFQGFLGVASTVLRCETFCLLFDPLAFAGDENLMLTGLFFFAGNRGMTRQHAGMAAYAQLFPTGLLTRLFALSRPMALLLAFVCTTL